MRTYQISANSADSARAICEFLFVRDSGRAVSRVDFLSGPEAPIGAEIPGTWIVQIS